jgi:hypothetical protein
MGIGDIGRRLANWRPANHPGHFSISLIVLGVASTLLPGLNTSPALSYEHFSISFSGLLIIAGTITYGLHKGLIWRWRRPYRELDDRYNWGADLKEEEDKRLGIVHGDLPALEEPQPSKLVLQKKSRLLQVTRSRQQSDRPRHVDSKRKKTQRK